MDPQALRFPKRLEHPSGKRLSLDPRYVLVEFRSAPSPNTLRKLRKFRPLTDPPGHARSDRRRRPFVPPLNQTDTRRWFSVPGSSRLDESLVRSIEAATRRRVAWIAPAYAARAGKEPASLVSPLPHVLLVRIPEELAPSARQEVVTDLRTLGREEDEERSRYQQPYAYFRVRDPLATNAHRIRRSLASGKHRGLDVRFEMMPMVKPITLVPNDTLYPQQWHMERIRAGGSFPSGWDLVTGDPSVVVCILDEGVDLGHPDLRFASNGINLGSMTGTGAPTGDHGTACAGIAAATIGNALGVAGVAGACRILPLALQSWTDAEVAAGIRYAADHGAAVISMSFGEYGPDDGMDPSGWDFDLIDPAIEYAHHKGLVLLAASGNENTSSFNRYPARHARVIAVGASDENDDRKSPASPDGESWGSNWAQGISVVAPGVHVRTTDRRGADGYNNSAGAAGNYFLTFNGTSAATPHVAGLAALLKVICPTRDPVELREIVERTADKVGATPYASVLGFPNGKRNQAMGYGRINVNEAVKEAMLYTLACLT